MTFPYKIGVNRCIERCNIENNPHYKTCLPDSIKNNTAKSLNLISREFVFKNVSFHQSCECGCLLDEKVCHNLQKFNKNECRCEYLKFKKCKNGYSWNVNNCRCETKKLARLIDFKEGDVVTDEIISKNISEFKILPKNKTLIKKSRKL